MTKHRLPISGREFGGRICCNSETKDVVATGAEVSTAGPDGDGWFQKWKTGWSANAISIQMLKPCPVGYEMIAAYHSHPIGGVFSPADLRGTARRYPFGLGSEDGEFVVTPTLGPVSLPPYGRITGVQRYDGFGLNPDGSLSPAPVLPDGNGGYTATVSNPNAILN